MLVTDSLRLFTVLLERLPNTDVLWSRIRMTIGSRMGMTSSLYSQHAIIFP
jgi:hypothetical protein